jgi:hypothetical protein
MEKVAGSTDPDAVSAMQSFIDQFSPVLAEVHRFLVSAAGRQATHTAAAGL